MKKIIVALLILVSTMPNAYSLTRDIDCLAKAMYWEARGEHILGKLAVASVVRYRVSSTEFPNSICEVVYQRNKRTKLPEFSSNIIRGVKPLEITEWKLAVKLAEDILTGKFKYQLEFTARFFHSTKINPTWENKVHVATIGGNKFYY